MNATKQPMLFALPPGPARSTFGTAHSRVRPHPAVSPVPRFGSSEQSPDSATDSVTIENTATAPLKKKWTLKERYTEWRQTQWLEWRKQAENYYVDFRKSLAKLMLGLAAIFSCFPIPGFMRRTIERRFFFAPHKVSSLRLLKSETLRKKTIALPFSPEGSNSYQLSAWYIGAKPGKPTVVFSHGRNCNISHLEHTMQALSDKGYGVFVYDYPGFGTSEGTPTEEGLYAAGAAACKYLATGLPEGLKRVPYDQQILMGHSLGGAVAVDIAKKFADDVRLENPDQRIFNPEDQPNLKGQPRALILINTFTNIKAAFADRKQDFHRWLQKLFNEDRIQLSFNSKEKIQQVSMPVLVLHGDRDQAISKTIGKQLEESATSSSHHEFRELSGAKHSMKDDSCRRIVDEMDDFLSHLNPSPFSISESRV